jgi:AraC-like DNA-binding protein
MNRYAELATLIARHAAEDGQRPTGIDTLFFGRRSGRTLPVHISQQPCFALVAQGEKTLTIGEHSLRYVVGDFLLVAMDVPVASCVTQATPEQPHLGVGIIIDTAKLKELMGRISMPPSALAAVRGLSVTVNRASDALLDAVLRLVRLLDTPQAIPALAPLIEQEILYYLLSGPCGPQLMHIAQADTPGNKIASAVSWLRTNFRAPLLVETLASHANMSASSLHQHFKSITGMTPMQYQKQLRLHEARRLLVLENVDVGSAGYQVGYQSPSHFSRDYSRMYGLPPQRDMDKLREQSRTAA